MTTSSAQPDNLATFVTKAGAATSDLDSLIGRASSAVDHYTSLPTQYHLVGGDAVIGDVRSFNTANHGDEQMVAKVRQAFVQADSGTVSDASIASLLKAAGISTADRTAVTIDHPTFNGRPITSGFSDDPVCTSTGHFLEVEDDLVMPDGLAVLRWTRTYSSRFVSAGAGGRGWSSFADCALDPDPVEIGYRGPDGQLGAFPVLAEGIDRDPVVEAVPTRTDGGYELVWPQQSRYPGMTFRFDDTGGLTAVVDRLGTVTTCERASGRLSALVHPSGRRLDLRWDGDLLAGLSCSDGREVTFRYEGGDLREVERPAGGHRYDVDGDGRITTVTDADGVRLAANTYDEAGRVLTQRSPFGRVTSYTYLAPRTVIVADDEGGPGAVYRHDEAGRLIELNAGGAALQRVFDDAGRPVRITDPGGHTSTFRYDTAGRLASETAADGGERTYGWDEAGRLVRLVDQRGAVTVFAYEGDSHHPVSVAGPGGLDFQVALRDGLPVRITDADGVSIALQRDDTGEVVAWSDATGATWRLERHCTGVVTAVVSPLGQRREIEVDGAGRVLASTSPTGLRTVIERSPAGRVVAVTEGDGARTEMAWGEHGAWATFTDALGHRSELEHDRLGNLTGVRLPDGARWAWEYDTVGQLVRSTDPAGASWVIHHDASGGAAGWTSPSGERTTVESDPVGRAVTELMPGGRAVRYGRDAAGLLTGVTTDTGARAEVVRDESGRPVEVSRDGQPLGRFDHTPAGRLAAVHLADGSTWTYLHDATGRVEVVEGPDGDRTRLEYDGEGRLAATVDASGARTELMWDPEGYVSTVRSAGAETRSSCDGAGRLTEVASADLGTRRFSYDARGDLTGVTDGNGATTTFRRDDRRNVVEVTDPLGASSVYAYDAADRLVAVTDPLGRRTGSRPDAAGRPVAVTLADGRELHLGYGPDDEVRSITIDGEVVLDVSVDAATATTTTATPTATTVQGWDASGQLIRRSTGGRDTVWERTRGERGSTEITVTAPGARPLVQEWDVRGRLVHLEHPATGPIDLRYESHGRLSEVVAGGLTRTWDRDTAGRVTRYRQQLAGGSVEETTIGYGPGDQVAHVDGPDGRTDYRYDPAGQLVAATGPGGTTTWSYDALGRLVEETHAFEEGAATASVRRLAYDAAGQVLEATGPEGTTSYEHDAGGRRVAERGPDGSTTYRWDALGTLVSVGAPTGAVDLRPDALGLPGSVGEDTVDWAFDGPGGPRPLAIGGDLVIEASGVPVSRVVGGEAEWLGADWQGSTPGTGPWGPAPDAEPRPGGGAGVDHLGLLTGAGLVLTRHRPYDPATHAFLAPDPLSGPIDRPGGPTGRYGYAANDPLRLYDPLGLKPLTIEQAKEQMQSWKHGHLGEIIVTGVALVGTAAIIVATGGAAAVVVPAVIGLVAGAGGEMADEALSGEPLDPMKIIMAGSVGALAGAGGGAFLGEAPEAGEGAEDAETAAKAAKASRLVVKTLPKAVLPRIGVTAAYGGGSTAVGSAAQQLAATGTIDPKDLAIDTAFGTAAGAIPPFLRTDFGADGTPAAKLPSVNTINTYNGVVQGHYMPLATGGAGIAKAETSAGPAGPPGGGPLSAAGVTHLVHSLG